MAQSVPSTSRPITRRTWWALLMLSLAGQLAWAVENQFYNTFMYDKITPNPQAVSWMVSITAVVSTLTAIFMGTLSDRTRTRWGSRRPYIFIGYIIWGIFTAVFPASALFQSVTAGIAMAILIDSLMTYFGATANDAALSAYIADVTNKGNRGKVSGAMEMMRWVALLIVYGGAGFIIQIWGYTIFFIAIGVLALLIGLVFTPQLQHEPELPRFEKSYLRQISETFSWRYLKENRDLFLVLIALTLFMFAFNVFFPYLMIYLQHFIKLPIGQSSLLIGVAILVGGIGAAYPIGLLVDRWGRRPVAILAVIIEAVGLLVFSFSRTLIPLVISGVLWLAPMAAWTISTAAWTKDLYPEDKRGQFAGYYILFNVAFTMIPGPLLGGWLSTVYGLPTMIDGKAGSIPPPLLFQVAAGLVLFTLIPVLLAGKKSRKSDAIGS